MADILNIFDDFSILISRLIRNFNFLERDEKVCFGLTITQCCTIETIAKKKILSMKELSNVMCLAASTMTRILDVMVRDGLVKREIDPNDRRSVLIELTAKGNDTALRLKECTEGYLKSIFEKVPDNKKLQINESLNLLLKIIEQHPSCCK